MKILKKIGLFLLGAISAVFIFFKINSKSTDTLTKEINISKEKANKLREDIKTQKKEIEKSKNEINDLNNKIKDIKNNHNNNKERINIEISKIQKKKEDINNATTTENINWVNEKYNDTQNS